MKQYYKEQLHNLLTLANIKVKFTSDNGSTNWLNVNKDSVEVIKDYFDKLATLNNL